MPPPSTSVRRRKTSFGLLLYAAGALVLVAGAAVLASTALSPEQLRDDLQDAVRRQTGRDLTVAGGVHLRLGLSPQIVLQDVSLANLPGGSRPQMLTARSVRASLALLPLLGGDAVISALTVEQPDLLLERVADGTPNWRFAPERRALYAGHGGRSGGGGHRVEIHALSLQGGQVSWRPAQGEPVTFDIDQLRVSSEDADSPLRLVFDGKDRDVPVSVKASSGSLQRLEGGPVSAVAGAWPLTVDVVAQDATLHIEGGFNHPEAGRGYQLRIKLDAPKLDGLNVLMPHPVLPPLAQVTASALLSDGSEGQVRTSQVAAHAGASDLSAWAAGLAIKQASFSAPGPGQLAQLTVDGSYADQPLRASATVMQPDVVGGTGPVQVTVDAQAAGGVLSAHGTAPPGLGQAGLDMQVSLHAPDLSQLSPLAGRPLPEAHDLAASAQIGDAGVRLRGVAVRSLSVTSSLGDVAGELTAVWSPRPDVTGTLTSRTLNLDGVFPDAASSLPAMLPPPVAAASPDTGQAALPPPSVAAPSTPPPDVLPLAQLRRGDADLTLSVGDLVFGGKHFGDAQAHLLLQDGKLALNPARAQTPDGPVTGGLSIDASSDTPPVAVALRSPSLSARVIAGALGYPQGASGTVQLDAQLSGEGQTWPALKATLGGHLGLAMVDGELDEAFVQGLLGAALEQAGVQSVSGGGNAQVRCLALRVDFRHGVGAVRAMSADTSRLTLDGSGQLDLSAGTLALHLKPRIRLGPTEVSAPVSLSGAFGDLHAKLDPVVGGNRFGLSIGGAPSGPSECAGRLALARNGLGGPMPQPLDAGLPPDATLVIRKPKDLLKGLFH